MGYWDACAPGLLLLALAVALLPWVDRNNTIARLLALSACLVLAWRYVAWRLLSTLPPVGDQIDFVVGIVFAGLEALTIVGSSISMLFLCRNRNRTREVERNLSRLRQQPHLPLVDVLVCTYNEEAEILERTLIGALALDYPRRRIWVCDDGRRPWLEALCARYEVGYLTRPDNQHAKAGNINAALDRLAALPDPPEFIAVLDADFVPLPQFLMRTVALASDPGIAIVQTPQHFFNPDPIQRNLLLTHVYPDEQRFFFDIVMPSKDAWGAAFCCGTSSLIRFDAVRSIGGFPTDSVTEDYLVSLRLREKGFQTVYLNEVLSLGLAPEGLAEYSGQRGRWCLGFMQICRGPSGPLKRRNNLPLIDRIVLLESFLYWAAAHAFRVLGLLVPVLYLLFDVQAVHADVLDAIDHALPYFVMQVLVYFWLTEGRVIPILSDLYQVLCANEVLKAVWVGLLRPSGHKFKVTAKGGDRSRRFVQWPLLRINLLLMGLTVTGIVSAFVVDQSRPLAESSSIALTWSWYNLIVLVLACYVCLEQPRYRASERFKSGERIVVRFNDAITSYEMYDFSTGGALFIGKAPAAIGNTVEIEFDGVAIPAQIVRITATGFAVALDTSMGSRIHMTRRMFSGRYSTGMTAISPLRIISTLTSRVFR